MMRITEIHIHPITSKGGLVAFAHIVLEGHLLLGSIGIHEKREGGLRLTYPQKGASYIFHPITRQFSKAIEDAVIREAKNVLEKTNDRQHSPDHPVP